MYCHYPLQRWKSALKPEPNHRTLMMIIILLCTFHLRVFNSDIKWMMTFVGQTNWYTHIYIHQIQKGRKLNWSLHVWMLIASSYAQKDESARPVYSSSKTWLLLLIVGEWLHGNRPVIGQPGGTQTRPAGARNHPLPSPSPVSPFCLDPGHTLHCLGGKQTISNEQWTEFE